MSVWLRELVGWLLLGVGLAVFGLCYTQLILNKRLLEAVPATFIGFVIFRGGMHLLKVATAARACREAARPAVAPKPVRRPLGPTRSVAEPRTSAIPGPTAARSSVSGN
jgi:hypothetical protein